MKIPYHREMQVFHVFCSLLIAIIIYTPTLLAQSKEWPAYSDSKVTFEDVPQSEWGPGILLEYFSTGDTTGTLVLHLAAMEEMTTVEVFCNLPDEISLEQECPADAGDLKIDSLKSFSTAISIDTKDLEDDGYFTVTLTAASDDIAGTISSASLIFFDNAGEVAAMSPSDYLATLFEQNILKADSSENLYDPHALSLFLVEDVDGLKEEDIIGLSDYFDSEEIADAIDAVIEIETPRPNPDFYITEEEIETQPAELIDSRSNALASIRTLGSRYTYTFSGCFVTPDPHFSGQYIGVAGATVMGFDDDVGPDQTICQTNTSDTGCFNCSGSINSADTPDVYITLALETEIGGTEIVVQDCAGVDTTHGFRRNIADNVSSSTHDLGYFRPTNDIGRRASFAWNVLRNAYLRNAPSYDRVYTEDLEMCFPESTDSVDYYEEINITLAGAYSPSIMAHEFGHILGFQLSPDSDDDCFPYGLRNHNVCNTYALGNAFGEGWATAVSMYINKTSQYCWIGKPAPMGQPTNFYQSYLESLGSTCDATTSTQLRCYTDSTRRMMNWNCQDLEPSRIIESAYFRQSANNTWSRHDCSSLSDSQGTMNESQMASAILDLMDPNFFIVNESDGSTSDDGEKTCLDFNAQQISDACDNVPFLTTSGSLQRYLSRPATDTPPIPSYTPLDVYRLLAAGSGYPVTNPFSNANTGFTAMTEEWTNILNYMRSNGDAVCDFNDFMTGYINAAPDSCEAGDRAAAFRFNNMTPFTSATLCTERATTETYSTPAAVAATGCSLGID